MKTLIDFVSNKRNMRTWMVEHETLMLALMGMTVELKDAMAAKDALYHYRNLTTSAPRSFKKVVEALVDQVESQCAEHRALVGADADADDVEDLEADSSPEMLLLAVANEGGARSHHDDLVPMLLHAWESFRHVLESLRFLPNLAHTYHAIAVRALRFLASFNRASEFRRLCGSMRFHLSDAKKAASDGEGFSADALALHLSTRFEQLSCCATLSLWNEAFRTAETIHEIIEFSGAKPDPEHMAAYFERLGAVFWVSRNYLFHAYACIRRYNTVSDSASREELASRAVLAATCVPLFTAGNDAQAAAFVGDSERDSKARLAALLSFTSTPSREGLIASIRSSGILDAASEAARDVFELLESTFAPLDLSKRCAEAMESAFAGEAAVESEGLVAATSSAAAIAAGRQSSIQVLAGGDAPLTIYRRRLCEQAVLRQTTQLGRAYSTITIESLFSMLEPLGLSRTDSEHVIVTAVRSRALDLRMDHRSNHVAFAGAELHGPALRSHLATLTKRLRDAVAMPAVSGSADARTAGAAGLGLRDPERRAATFAAAREAAQSIRNSNMYRVAAITDYQSGLSRAYAIKEMEVRTTPRARRPRACSRAHNARMQRLRGLSFRAPSGLVSILRWPPNNPCNIISPRCLRGAGACSKPPAP